MVPDVFLHFWALWVRFLCFPCRPAPAVYTNVKSHKRGKVSENVHETCCGAFEGLQVRYIWNALYTGGRQAALKRGEVDLPWGREETG